MYDRAKVFSFEGGVVSAFTYDVGYVEARNRLTVGFRFILAIPHLIVAQVWGYLAQVLAVVQWFIVLFTGERNEGIWDLQRSWLHYYGRVLGYTYLLFDTYPAFGTDPGQVPVRSDITFEGAADRLTNGLRFIWIIPAALLGFVLGIAASVLLVISWFAIVITGKHPRGMWDFLLKVTRYSLQVQSYGLLMTDTYPRFEDSSGAVLPPPKSPTPLAPPGT
jgi:Domain of unknown function (DUF4389)